MSYIYLDNAATTQVSESAAKVMLHYAREEFYNPSAGYAPALEVRKQIKRSANEIAGILGASGEEIIFTSCATESNNHAFSCGIKNKKGNVIVSSMEHASVYECAMRLKSKGIDVRFVNPDSSGHILPEDIAALADSNTAFVSIIHCSNETGTINDIQEIVKAVKKKSPSAIFHCDGVQAFCKIPTDVKKLGIDMYSVSAHKVGGMKGTGALYVRKGLNLPAFIAGGGQQESRRAGTENVCGIMSFAIAATEYRNAASNFNAHELRDIFIQKFAGDEKVKINGSGTDSGYVISISFLGLRGEIIAHGMEDKGILVGLGSACSTHIRSNRVLGSMGVSKEFAEGSIRISFSPHNNTAEAITAADALKEITDELRVRMSR